MAKVHSGQFTSSHFLHIVLTIARLVMDSAGAAGMSGGSWGGASTARGSTLAR
ncbi:MAG: hypothetical protein ACPIOQ_33415 [Promethearchaeia archaeon]